MSETIGNRILNIRGKESRASFSEKLAISATTLQRYETNEKSPSIDFLTKLKNLTGYSLDYLVYGKVKIEKSNDEITILKKFSSVPLKTQDTILSLLLLGVDNENYDKENNIFKFLPLSIMQVTDELRDDDKFIDKFRLASSNTRHEIMLLLLGVQDYKPNLKPLTFEDHHQISKVVGKKEVIKSKAYRLIKGIYEGMGVDCVEFMDDDKNINIKNGVIATYRSEHDLVIFHNLKCFNNINEYLFCLLHELGHATGHESRLNRDLGKEHGSESYAKEELRALYFSAIMAEKLEISEDCPNYDIVNIEYYEKFFDDKVISELKIDAMEIFNFIKNYIEKTHEKNFKNLL